MRPNGVSASLALAFSNGVPRKAATVAAVVAPILILINQGDALFGAASFDIGKALLTAVVPYVVATVGAVSALVSQQTQSRSLPTDALDALARARQAASALQDTADSEPQRSLARMVLVNLEALETPLSRSKA